jgi:peptidoglycan/xylan/chitin deacetylase (PgdA/CDA1 family)
VTLSQSALNGGVAASSPPMAQDVAQSSPQVPTQDYGQDAPESAELPAAGPTIAPSPGPTPTVTPTASVTGSASTTPSGTPTPTTPTAPSTSASPAAKSTKLAKGKVTVTIDFDDGTADQYQVAPLLKAHDMDGVFFINSGRIGLSSTYMTAAQISALQADGNEIGGHTVFHLHLPQQSLAEQERQICTDRDQLLARGLRITDMAFPFGDYTAATQQAVRFCGYNSVRTSEGSDNAPDSLPPGNPYALKALSSLNPTTPASYITKVVTNAENHGGGLIQLVFHRVCDQAPCRSNAIRLSVFKQVLDWLAAARTTGDVAVKTIAQVIGGTEHALVAGPAPTATLEVPNASFELGTSAADTPVCWEHTVTGDGNVATWSQVTDAHSGHEAEHLVASKITSGVALVVTQDEGSCAAPITVGDRYTYSVWYKSSAPIQLVAYRRLTAGGYLTFGLSKPFPASPNTWAHAVVMTQRLPAGSTGISVGVAVKTAGQFTFDDFALANSGPPPPKLAVAAATATAPSPSVAPLQIPLVAAGSSSTDLFKRSWTGKAYFIGLLLLVSMALVLIDLRLARIRRSTQAKP